MEYRLGRRSRPIDGGIVGLNADCNDSLYWSYVRSEAKQFKAMPELEKKAVVFERWSDDVLAVFRE